MTTTCRASTNNSKHHHAIYTNNCSFSDVSKRIFALTEGHRADVSASNSIAIVSTGEKKNEVYPPYAVSRSAQPNTTTITDKGRMNKLKEDGP